MMPLRKRNVRFHYFHILGMFNFAKNDRILGWKRTRLTCFCNLSPGQISGSLHLRCQSYLFSSYPFFRSSIRAACFQNWKHSASLTRAGRTCSRGFRSSSAPSHQSWNELPDKKRAATDWRRLVGFPTLNRLGIFWMTRHCVGMKVASVKVV